MGIYHSKLAISCALHRGDGVLHFNLYKTIIKINDFFFHTFKRVRAPENSFSSSWLPKRDLSFVDKVHHPLQIGKFRNWHYCETSSSIFKDFPSTSFKIA